MTPPAAQATARARRVTRETSPQRNSRPHLRVLSRGERRSRARRRAIARPLSVLILVGTLVAIVVAHTMVASDQVRLTDASSQLAAEQVNHDQLELSVAGLESPQHIATKAAPQHLSLPTSVVQLPYVPLNVPLAAPTMAPAPPPATTTTTTASATTTTTAPTTTQTTTPATGQ